MLNPSTFCWRRFILNRANPWPQGLVLILGFSMLAWAGSETSPIHSATLAADNFYVATNGNDGWSGKLAEPNHSRTDGPFASLSRARDAIRESKRQHQGNLPRPVIVQIGRGHYFLTESLVFTPEDSGTPGSSVLYAGEKGAMPVVSGGRRITGWQQTNVLGRPLWSAEIPAARDGRWFFRQLWVNGQRRFRARHPNTGYLAVAELPGVPSDAPWDKGQSSFRYAPGDLKAWPSITNAEICIMNRWVESHLPVSRIDEAERMIYSPKRSVFKLDRGDLYYVEHALELLDTPGEWYLDAGAGRIFYWPMPGETMEIAEVIAPVLPQLIRLQGRPEKGQWIEHLGFQGIQFSHTEWYFPGGFDTDRERIEVEPAPAAEVGGFAQAAVGVPGAVRAEGMRGSRFEQCRLVNLGGYGLELGRGCQSNQVSQCELEDLGAGGIKLGETRIRDNPDEVASHNEITQCHIGEGGRFYHSAIGVWIGQSPGNRLLRNHIHDFYYTGISVGWTWGYSRALATNTTVEFNHVHHIGKWSNGDGPILSDMAGIYTLGLHTGSVIRNNLWHDIAGLRYGGWGIYFDEGTTRMLAENNLVMRTTHGGFHQHYGKENLVRNNIFVDARDFQIQRSRVENHRSFTFTNNIVYWHQGKLLEGNFSDTNYLFQSNLYWRAGGGDIRFDKWSWDEWRKRGQDTQSLIANPKFRNPEKDDYSLAPDSPALPLGFKPLNLQGAGTVINPNSWSPEP